MFHKAEKKNLFSSVLDNIIIAYNYLDWIKLSKLIKIFDKKEVNFKKCRIYIRVAYIIIINK